MGRQIKAWNDIRFQFSGSLRLSGTTIWNICGADGGWNPATWTAQASPFLLELETPAGKGSSLPQWGVFRLSASHLEVDVGFIFVQPDAHRFQFLLQKSSAGGITTRIQTFAQMYVCRSTPCSLIASSNPYILHTCREDTKAAF